MTLWGFSPFSDRISWILSDSGKAVEAASSFSDGVGRILFDFGERGGKVGEKGSPTGMSHNVNQWFDVKPLADPLIVLLWVETYI